MATTAERRAEAVAETVAKVRAIEAAKGITPEALDGIKAALSDLARRKELFPRSDFPKADLNNDIFIRLSEDPDKRFALYLNSGSPGKQTPPHNHTTWAVIAGIEGSEHNKVYRRTDDGSVPGKGTVEVDFQVDVGEGEAIGFMPEDIHSIHVLTDAPILHLHMYGQGLEQLRGRIYFDQANGTYSRFPSHPDIR
ncbi:cysteine dioxygenase family protein [Oceanibaculum pacificum]|uniref:Cysteine dioxygenase n=1 Tax=Oceanibaculum pacificum TaxID=580166 RepID=A0A154VXD6_9PROT|nr:cysteine dioxygenase family protein [Oceanibaculum pacificum]KZD05869.1 hypothetical protein AUP43_02870 [Oceanibaculum pacificum]